MTELTRFKPALLMAAFAAGLWALGELLAGVAPAILASPSDVGTYRDLNTAAAWLLFAASAVGVAATASVTWHLFVSRRWTVMWEVAGATVSTLFLAIGTLVIAATTLHESTAGNVLTAIGVGGWAIVVLAGAGRHALAEQDDPALPRQAVLRLLAAGSLVVVAVSFGLPSPQLDDATLAISAEVLFAVGFAGLAAVVMSARSRALLRSKSVAPVEWGLWLLVVSGLAGVVAAGIVYGPPPTSVTAFRTALPISPLVQVLAVLALGWAALSRVAELDAPAGAAGWPDTPSPGVPVTSPPAVPPSWQSDPTQRNELRWWDGVRWTDHVLNGNLASVDPLPPPGPPF